MSRSSDYLERRSTPIFLGEMSEECSKALESFSPSESGFDIMVSTKEIIFRNGDNGPELDYVMFSLDAKTLEVVIAPGLVQVDMSDKDLKYRLALALLFQIPVYPDTEKDEAELLRWHRLMVDEGFEVKSQGKTHKLRVTDKVSIFGKNTWRAPQNPFHKL